MASSSKRAVLGALTLAGLVLAGIGLWFTSHLGLSGNASFSASPKSGHLVVLDPSVLGRVDSPVSVTARTKDGSEVWVGRAAPSDAAALVGKAATTSVTGVSVSDWSLTTSQTGAGTAPALAQADLWRQQANGKGNATLTVEQDDAPETVVVATASGKPADLAELTVEWQRQAWSVEALAVLLLGLLVAVAGALGLWRLRPTAAEAGQPDHDQDHGQGPAPDQGQEPRPVHTSSPTTVPGEDRS